MDRTHITHDSQPPQQRKSDRLNTELSATPVATLGVVLDLTISLEPEPLRKRLVSLILYTQGALGPKTLVTRHLLRHTKQPPTETNYHTSCEMAISWSLSIRPFCTERIMTKYATKFYTDAR